MKQTRFRTKAGLIVAALAVQGVVLSSGWFLTFRVVQRSFARVIEERTIDQNRDIAQRVASLLPDVGDGVEFGGADWDRLQSIIEGDALKELPDGGFACLIEPDGQLLCHPDIHDQPGLRGYSFDGKSLRTGTGSDATARDLLSVTEADASGVVEFAAGDFHYVASRPLAGSDLRLLVHQPVGALVKVGKESTRWVMGAAGLAVLAVLGITGAGLVGLLRRYESVHVELNRQLHENLSVARTIQESSLPETLPSPAGYEIAAWSGPAEETGGDTYDVMSLAGETGQVCTIGPEADGDQCRRIAFLLADATGHGVGPALAVTQLNAMSRLAWRMGGALLDVARLVNEQLDARLPDGRFVTAVFGEIETASGDMELLSAGQGPLVIWRADSDSMEEVETDTYPLGIMPELGATATTRVRLGAGDVFCAISDGIFEAMSPAGEEFGVGRLGALLGEHGGATPERLIEEIRAAVESFTGNAPPSDDRTVLLIKRALA